MIKELLEEFLDENMDAIVHEVESVEEEEEPIPEVRSTKKVVSIFTRVRPTY